MSAHGVGRIASYCLTITVLAGQPAYANSTPETAYDKPVGDFALNDITGKQYRLSDYAGAKGIVIAFTGLGCPLSNLYTPRIESLAKKYGTKGIKFLIVNSNVNDSVDDLARAVRTFEIKTPLLKDVDNKVADALGAHRTNEAFLLDGRRIIRYHGAIDDQYGIGYQRAAAAHAYLADAIDQLLAGKSIAVPRTQAVGCIIGRKLRQQPSAVISYHEQIQPIMQQSCQSCHRPGQIGPFTLATYEDAAGRAKMIKEVVTQRRMPPWHADPRYGQFVNDRSLAQDEIDAIVAWVDSGAAKGDPASAPPPVQYPDGWLIGKPDAVIEMPIPFDVPAEGVVDYQYFPVATNFGEDKYVIAGEIKPGAPTVVHHVLTAVLRPEDADYYLDRDSRRQRPNRRCRHRRPSIEESIFFGSVPGQMPCVYPEGAGKLLPKSGVVLFQMHYTPDGTRRKDRTKIGLIFANEPVKHLVKSGLVGETDFIIPPNEANHRVRARHRLRKDIKILSLMPHMHLRGRAFRYTVQYPDGRSERVLDVPAYDFGWQIRYLLTDPLFLPRSSEIHCLATYDNSPNNPWNPDPDEAVYFGDQTDEEMMFGFFDYVEVSRDELLAARKTVSSAPDAAATRDK